MAPNKASDKSGRRAVENVARGIGLLDAAVVHDDHQIRDRKRLKRLFGFDYTIEIFVPEAKRLYGYYVYPLLDGDRLVGRVDAKADRDASALAVRKIWTEKGIVQDPAFRARRATALQGLAGIGSLAKVRVKR